MRLLGHLCALIVAAALAVAGAATIMQEPVMLASFERWNYPLWFMLVVGCIEAIASVLVLFPFSRLVGAGLAISVMVGALGTHALNGELFQMIPPAVLGVLAVGAGLVGRSRR